MDKINKTEQMNRTLGLDGGAVITAQDDKPAGESLGSKLKNSGPYSTDTEK